MKEKTIFTLIIFALIAINGYTLIRFKKLKQQKLISEVKNHLQEIRNNGDNSYKLNFITNIMNSNLYLSDVMVKDVNNTIIPLLDTFERGQKQLLICRFSQSHCESCVDFSIQFLKERIDIIGRNNLIFLGNHRNNFIFFKTVTMYDIHDLRVYNCPTINIQAEELGFPYYFVLNSDLQISNVFVPDKSEPHIANEYLENIGKRFLLINEN